MRPLTVLTGIVLGSSVATTFGLGATLIVFLVLVGDETAQFREELPLLAVYVAIFVGLTALAAVSFIGQARRRPGAGGRRPGDVGRAAGLAALYVWTRV